VTIDQLVSHLVTLNMIHIAQALVTEIGMIQNSHRPGL